MYTYTRTSITDAIDIDGKYKDLVVTVEHDKNETLVYELTCGCVNIWFMKDDFDALARVINKARLIRKKAIS